MKMFNLFCIGRQKRKLVKILKILRETLIVISLLFMVLFTFVAVLFRYLPGLEPIFWSEELLRYTFVWLVFLSLSISVEKKELLGGIDIISNHLTFGPRKILEIAYNMISIIFLMLLIFYGVKMVKFNTAQRASSLPIRLSVVYLAIPIGSFLSVIGFISHIIENIASIINKNKRK